MSIPPGRLRAIRTLLLAWWDAGHRQLPWRFPQHGADPYRVWLAEVMLQQTQVAVVVPYYQRFVRRFPTLQALAAAADDEVLAQWSGLGYYARARRLASAAREAIARHGALPRSPEALAALPGFGRYTAGAVASIAFAIRAACVDGNVARVLSRLFLLDGSGEDPRVRERLWTIAEALVPRERPGDFNQALMELGATVCAKAAPRCSACPLARGCEAREAGRELDVPTARSRARPRRLIVACAVVRRGESFLIARRPPRGLFGGLWELPSVEVAPGADPRSVLTGGLRDRLGLRLIPGEELAAVDRVLTHRRLRLTGYTCRAHRTVRLPAGVRFATRDQLRTLGLATAMRALIDALPCGDGA